MIDNLKFCRLCLISQTNFSENKFIEAFEHFEHSLTLADVVYKCTSVKITVEDEIPKCICLNCVDLLTKLNEFVDMCRRSEVFLFGKYKNEKIEFPGSNKRENNIHNKDDSLERELHLSTLSDNSPAKSSGTVEESSKGETIFKSRHKATNLENCFNENEDVYIIKGIKDDNYLNCQNDNSHKEGQLKDCENLYNEQDFWSGKYFKKSSARNMRKIIGENKYICEICNEEFVTFFDYHDHQNTHDGQLVFKCSKCTEIFKNRKELLEHDSKHKMSCEICSLQILPRSMAAHLLLHTDVHKCNQCGMRHASNASLEKHIKARHSGIRGFLCHICGKQSSCQSSMNRHMGYHGDERPFKCKYCDFCAKSINIVQVHTSRKHFAEKTVCEICAKIFKSQLSLIQHTKRIHSERKFVCNVCSKRFIERYNLNKHLKRHASQRLHECKLCHKEFLTVRRLKDHMHSHRSGCVSCAKCGKEFYYKKYFNKHSMKCTGSRDN